MFKLQRILESFKIKGKVHKKELGAVVDSYYIKMQEGEKLNKLRLSLESIALSLEVESMRLLTKEGFAVLEVPTNSRKTIQYNDLKDGINKSKLELVAGETVNGEKYYIDLKKAPHLLVAGATGSGKSVFLNSAITGLIENYDSNDVKLVLIDPKRVEFSMFGNIKHLFCDIAKDIDSAENVLSDLIYEMEERYLLLSINRVRNIDELREKGIELPYIVCVVDEFADLVLNNKNVEALIQSLAQKSRACGIHLIIATQRPSVDVITGKIKANFPSRLAFQVVSKYDSKTILDESGAEALLGKGDALFMQSGEKIRRIHCCYIDNETIDNATINLMAEVNPIKAKKIYNESTLVEWFKWLTIFFSMGAMFLFGTAWAFWISYGLCAIVFLIYIIILNNNNDIELI